MVTIVQTKVEGGVTSYPMGCASIHLRSGSDRRHEQYIEMEKLKASNKGWHASWFYLKNEEVAPLPSFTSRLVAEEPAFWKYGP